MAEQIIKYAVKRVLFFKGRRYDPTVTPFAFFPEGVVVDEKTFVPVGPVAENPAGPAYDAAAEKKIRDIAGEHGLDGSALKQIYDDAAATTSKEKLAALETYHQLVSGEPDPTEPEDAPDPGAPEAPTVPASRAKKAPAKKK